MSTVPTLLHVVVSLAPGGLERLVVDLTNGRNERWPGRAAVCCLDEAGAMAGQLGGAPPRVMAARRDRFPMDWAAVWRLRRVVRSLAREGNAAVHSHNLASWQYATCATLGLGVPHVHTEHGSNPHGAGLKNRLRIRWLASRADALVAVSEDTARALAKDQGLPRERIVVVPNGLPIPPGVVTSDARAVARRALGLDNDAWVVGAVGRLAPVKGQDRLIHAFGDLRRTTAGARAALLLIGDGPDRARLESLVGSLGLAADVRFAGHRADARDLYAAIDLFVLPSRSEGLSVALLEAMAAGCPVAATGVGESRAALADGACGRLLPDDVREWSAVLADERAAAGGAAVSERVHRARERVRDRYSFDAMLDAYEAIYLRAIERRRGQR
jgi:glycosyltransferase involved in cell wall biosynthesis